MGAGETNEALGRSISLTMAAELKALDVAPEVPGGTSIGKVGDAAAAVEMGATKVQMLFADGNGVAEDAAASVLKDFHVNVITFVAYAQSAMGSEGKTFDAGLKAAACAVSKTSAALVAAATSSAAQKNALKDKLAEVWGACRAITKLPKNGRAAISKALMNSATFIKDVSNELAELGQDENGDEGDDEFKAVPLAERDEDDMRFDDNDFDEDEMRVAKQAAGFAAASFQFIRAVVAPVVRGTATDVHALERVLDACQGFQRGIEEVGAGVYPPQDTEEMGVYAGQAIDKAREMGVGVVEAGGVEGTEEAVAALEGAYQQLREVLEAAKVENEE